MSLPVLTAVTDASWEDRLVAALEGTELGVTVVRRCIDVPDLLATAATGSARAVVLSADLRRLDRDVLVRLRAAQVAVVGLVAVGDDAAERRMLQLGVQYVLPADAQPPAVAAALAAAASAVVGAPIGVSDPRAALEIGPPPIPEADNLVSPPAIGQIVAVWGPIGAPGRTTVAVGLADEAARLGVSTLLIDADSYGPSIAHMLGLLDEAPGLAAATHLDNQGLLDVVVLAGLTRAITPTLRVLTGINRADRWPELRSESVRGVLQQARSLAQLTIVDCAFCLEDDEELSYDTVAPRRNGATLAALDAADLVIVVGAGDPVGVQRLVRGISELARVAPGAAARARVVVNKVRKGPVSGEPAQQIFGALNHFAGVAHIETLPYDLAAADKALVDNKTLAECAPESALRSQLARLAGMLVVATPAPAQ